MDTAGRYVQGQEMLRGNINYVEEIKELKHQINMLKLDVNQPEIIQPSAYPIPPLNRLYESRSQATNGSGYERWLVQVECWNCSNNGHLSFNCPSLPKRNNNNNNG